VNFADGTVAISGQAPAITNINQFIDTLKFTTYTTGEQQPEDPKAFSEVVLNSFTRSEELTDYQIKFKFDPAIFDVTKTIELKVPNITTTRSAVERPTDLFQGGN
jgi:hypothetical protein